MGACASRSKVLKGEAIDAPAPEETVSATEAPEVATVKEVEETKGNSEAAEEEATSPPEAVEKEESKAEPEEKPTDVTPPPAEAEEEKKTEEQK